MTMPDNPLAGRVILVVEDEFFVAKDLKQTLAGVGATVVGPAPTLDRATGLIAEAGRLDGAILDVNLSGEAVFPAADLLRQQGIPFLFTTGYDQSTIPERFAGVPRCEKPVGADKVCRHLAELLGAGSGGRP